MEIIKKTVDEIITHKINDNLIPDGLTLNSIEITVLNEDTNLVDADLLTEPTVNDGVGTIEINSGVHGVNYKVIAILKLSDGDEVVELILVRVRDF